MAQSVAAVPVLEEQEATVVASAAPQQAETVVPVKHS
jgi:hypothetical protein